MRDSKRPIMSSVFNKMMKKFEGTGTSSRCCCYNNGADGAIHVGSFCTWGMQCLKSFEADKSVWRALRRTLKQYPYKLQHNQELKPPDFDSRQDFANLVFNKMKEHHDWLHTVL